MTETDNGRNPRKAEDIGKDFFSDYEIALLRGFGFDIPETNLGPMSKSVKRSVVYLRKAIHSLKNRLGALEGSHDKDYLRFSFLEAFDMGLVDVPNMPGYPVTALTGDEQRVWALLSLGYSNNYIGRSDNMNWHMVNDQIKTITEKFGTETIYPVIARGRLEMRKMLEKGNA